MTVEMRLPTAESEPCLLTPVKPPRLGLSFKGSRPQLHMSVKELMMDLKSLTNCLKKPMMARNLCFLNGGERL